MFSIRIVILDVLLWNMPTILAKANHDLAEHDRDAALVILERAHGHVPKNMILDFRT